MQLGALRLLVALLSVALMVSVCGLTLALWSGSQVTLRELRSAVGETSWLIQQKDVPGIQPPPLDADPARLRELESLPGVEKVALYGSGSKILGGRRGYATSPVNSAFFEVRGLQVARGRIFTAPHEAVVGAGLADTLGQEVSDGLATARVVGVLRPVGARGDIDRHTDRIVFMNLDGYLGLASANQAIVRATPERFAALRPSLQAWADGHRRGGYDVVPLADQYGTELRRRVADLLSGALGFGVVACVLAGALNLGAFFLARAMDGLRSVGIRRAAGATRAQVLREDVARALVWALPGLALGLPAAAALSIWAGRRLELPVQLDVPAALLLTVLTLAVVALAAWMPARWAGQQSPTTALRGVAAALPRAQALLMAAGLTLGTAGLVVQANTAEAARAETLRTIGRVPEGVFSFNPALIQGETFTDPRGQLDLTPSLLDDLRARPEWADVVASSARTITRVNLQGSGVTGGVVSTAPVTLIEDPLVLARLSDAGLLSGRWPGAGEVAVGEAQALTMFGRTDVVGRRVTVKEAQRELSGDAATISGVFRAPSVGVVGGLSAEGIVAPWDAPYPLTKFTFLVFQVRDPATAQRLADWANTEYGGVDTQPLRPLPPLELAPQVRGVLLQLSDVYRLLSGALLLLGGAGLTAQLLLMLARRFQEIGVRRAVGASRLDIYRQFMAESGRLGVLASGTGVALGLLATLPVVRAQGVPLAINPVALALALGVGVGTALVFGALPAGLATRVPPSQALRELE